MNATDAIVSIENIRLSGRSAEGGCSIAIFPGEFVAVGGRSGSEKTALPAFIVWLFHVPVGCHLQSKFLFKSTLLALNLPETVAPSPLGTSADVNLPSFLTVL